MRHVTELGAVWLRGKNVEMVSCPDSVITQLCDLGCSLSCTMAGSNQGKQIGSTCAMTGALLSPG